MKINERGAGDMAATLEHALGERRLG